MVPESGTPCGVSRSNGDLLGGITEIGQAPKPHPMALSRTTEESLRAWAEGLILAPARGLVRKLESISTYFAAIYASSFPSLGEHSLKRKKEKFSQA